MKKLGPKQRHRAAVFARDPHLCALRPERTGWPDPKQSTAGPCEGRLEADHILKVSALFRHRDRLRLRRDPLTRREKHFMETAIEELVADERNGWILCSRHHHLKDDRLIEIVAEVILPPDLALFVAEYDLLAVYGAELHPRIMPASGNGSRRSGAPRRGI